MSDARLRWSEWTGIVERWGLLPSATMLEAQGPAYSHQPTATVEGTWRCPNIQLLASTSVPAVEGAKMEFVRGQTNAEYFARRWLTAMAWALRLRATRTKRLMEGEDVDLGTCLLIDPGIEGLDGFLAQLSQPEFDETFDREGRDSYLNNLCWNQIDGRYASMAKDLSLVVGAATLKDLGSTYRNASVDRSALDRLMELTAGVRVSAHVPAPATNRQDAVIRRGMSTTATAPVWEGVTIIPDEVTKAKAGQIVITAVMLFAMKVLRTGAGPFAACGFTRPYGAALRRPQSGKHGGWPYSVCYHRWGVWWKASCRRS